MKNKETLEEAAERLYPNYQQEIFIEGAKWQQERSYSEEEVYNLLKEAMKDCYNEQLEHHYSGDFRNLKDWFEQIKKK